MCLRHTAVAAGLLVSLLMTACSQDKNPANKTTNTPPVAEFTVTPATGDTTTRFIVNASASRDNEDLAAELLFRWDWQHDGTWDTPFSPARIDSCRFSAPGAKTIALQVRDTDGNTVVATRQVTVTTAQSVQPVGMRYLLGGTFQMGDNLGPAGEYPVHAVTLTPFWIDTVEAAQILYQQLMQYNPSASQTGGLKPVENVTWFDAVLFCNVRSKQDHFDTLYAYTGVTGVPGNGCSGLNGLTLRFHLRGYRLPTEAEWEYACRADSVTRYFYGNDTTRLGNYAWYHANTNGIRNVATKAPNGYRLFDMSGNVAEWCHDWHVLDYYATSPVNDPLGPASGAARVLRGGSWRTTADQCRSAFRASNNPAMRGDDLGFRCVFR